MGGGSGRSWAPYLVVTMVPRLWMDFLRASVSISSSSWSFSSGWQDTGRWASCCSCSSSSCSTSRLEEQGSPSSTSSHLLQEASMAPSTWTRCSTWACRTCRDGRRATAWEPSWTRVGGDRTHLLLESVGDLQLHQQDALPHVQLLVQVLEGGLDVLLHGASLGAQLLEDLPDQVQGVRDLGQSGTDLRASACVAVTTAGLKPDWTVPPEPEVTGDSPVVHRGQRPLEAAALLLQALLQGQGGVVLMLHNAVLTQHTGTGGAVQVGYLDRAESSR